MFDFVCSPHFDVIEKNVQISYICYKIVRFSDDIQVFMGM